MNKISTLLYQIKENIFAYSLSIIIHLMLLSFVLYNSESIKNMISANIKRDISIEEIEQDDYVILVDTIDIEEKEEYIEEKTKFVSDKNIHSQGEPEVMPNLLPNLFKPIIEQREATFQNESIQNIDKQEETIVAELKESLDGEIEIYKPESQENTSSEKKIPSTFNEAADRAIVFSSETGKMRLGTRAMPYYWYFKGLVSGVSRMWGYTIPNQAHHLGLIRSDEVELLLSIDENGDVEFVEFLKESNLGQNSLNNSCKKAIEYTGNIGIPPAALYDEYQENGKIYIPFRFIYQNNNSR